MKLNNYLFCNLEIKVIESGKQNAGQRYISGVLENQTNDMAKPRQFAFFEETQPRRFQAILNAFPVGSKYNGDNKEIAEATFDKKMAEAALQNVDGKNMLLFQNGCYEKGRLPEPHVRKFSQDLGGHKEGEWVMDPTGSYVGVIETLDVFVLRYSQEEGDYVEGWDLATQMKSQMRNLIPLSKALKDDMKDVSGKSIRDVTPPRYLENGEQKPIGIPDPDEQ